MDGIDAHLIQTLVTFDTIYLGFSGGLDSCVLLHILCQNESIRRKLTAIHVNHGLSSHALDWVKQTKALCHDYSVRYQDYSVTIHQENNIEEAARQERYSVFERLLLNDKTVLLLAHHQNDQAETLLLHLLRGSGIDGLAAMPEWRSLGQGQLYRPLLQISRQILEDYAKKQALTWIEDESNHSLCFDRNFLRHQIMPLLEERWPALVNNLSRSAAHCAAAKQQIDDRAKDILPSLFEQASGQTDIISIKILMQHPRDMQKVLLRCWIEKQGGKKPSQVLLKRILDEVIPASMDANPVVSWKGGEVRRYQGGLYFIGGGRSSMENPPFAIASCPLLQSGQSSERCFFVDEKESAPNVQIRYRQGGETIRLSGKTRELKKLFQAWRIPPWDRDKIPLIYINNVLACVCGWAVSDDFKNS